MASSITFTIVEATLADLEPATETIDAAFGKTPFRRQLYPPHLAHLTPPGELNAWRAKHFTKTFIGNKGKCFKAVSPDSDKILGISIWYPPNYDWDGKGAKDSQDEGSEATNTLATTGEPPVQSKDELPACIEAELFKLQIAALAQMKREIWGDDTNFWYLNGLAVHSDHQRRGIGAELLKWGLKAADRDGLPIYLEASAAGKHLYELVGFHEVGKGTVEWLGETHELTAMRREPVTQQGS